MSGLLFITADAVDLPFVNRLLLYLRDWEYGEDPYWDVFRLVTSKIDSLNEGEGGGGGAIPPLQNFSNEWADESLGAVERFMLEAAKYREEKDRSPFNLETFLVLDDVGAQEGTIILLERKCDWEDEDEDGNPKTLDAFQKIRIPWDQAYLSWCNLDISNINFEDLADQDKGEDEDGWWVYQKVAPHPTEAVRAVYEEAAAEVARKRTAAIKALHDVDLA